MVAPELDVVINNLLDQIRGAWRFHWTAVVVAWCLAIVLWMGVFVIPDTYQASARVFVDTNTALSKVTRGISVDADVETQIQRVRQALLGGPQLQKVAEETGLLMVTASPPAKQAVINNLRAGIDISGGISPSAGVFTISYKNHSREKSLEVVDRLVNTFVQGALGGKHQGSEEAQQFLVNEIQEYERRLAEAEERLADFKRSNVGLMPGAEGDYFTKLQAEQEALDKARQTLAVTQRRRDELYRQLHGDLAFATPTEHAKPTDPAEPEAADTASRIRQTQAKLDDMLLHYTDEHPDVIALRETLDELKGRQEAEIAAVKRGDPGAAERLGVAANPVYQNLQLQYNQTQVDIGGVRAEITDRQTKIDNLRGLINTAPEVEAEFARLNRDYDVTRVQYRALLERLEHSRIGEEAEATGVVKFEVIDPPAAGFAPIAPSRRLLIAGSSVAALAAGGAFAYLLSLMQPVFFSARQISAATGRPVLGEVSLVWLDKLRARNHRGIALYAGTVSGLLIATVVLLVLQRPILSFVRDVLVFPGGASQVTDNGARTPVALRE